MSSVRTFAAVLRFLASQLWLVLVALVGFIVAAVGLVLLVTPGPGLLVIVAGLAILSTQFAWAAKALDYAKAKAVQARDSASRRAAARRTRLRHGRGHGHGHGHGHGIPPKSPPEAF